MLERDDGTGRRLWDEEGRLDMHTKRLLKASEVERLTKEG